MAKVSVIIPTMKGREAMLAKLLSTLPEDCEKIVVDDENLLLAAKRNKGARQAKGEFLLFIDDDNYLRDGAVRNMIHYFKPHYGVMGMVACYHDKPLLVADGGSVRSYTSGFMDGLYTNSPIWRMPSGPYEVDEVANAFMIPKAVFDEVGGFDEVNFPIDLDEADICKRIKDNGYLVMMNPASVCYHKSQTYSCVPDFRRPMSAYFMGRNKVLFQGKHLSPMNYVLYLFLFLPITLAGYTVCLFYRKKPRMLFYFLKGVFHGIIRKRTFTPPKVV